LALATHDAIAAMIEKLLAFDFGLKRVGVGLGITVTGTASPLQTIAYPTTEALMQSIDSLVEEWKPQLLLIGLPNLDSGLEHSLEKPIKKFSNRLKHRYQLPVEFIDESFSSQQAENRLKQMRQSGRRKKIQKHEIDMQAAALLAEQWLEQKLIPW